MPTTTKCQAPNQWRIPLTFSTLTAARTTSTFSWQNSAFRPSSPLDRAYGGGNGCHVALVHRTYSSCRHHHVTAYTHSRSNNSASTARQHGGVQPYHHGLKTRTSLATTRAACSQPKDDHTLQSNPPQNRARAYTHMIVTTPSPTISRRFHLSQLQTLQ